jgi:phosphatidyl-myo-inositol alpha-mannosyltransferase
MRIGMVTSDLPQVGKKPGGVSIVVHELANSLVRAGNYVRVYSYSNKPRDAEYESFTLSPWINERFSRQLDLPFQITNLDFSDLDVLHLHGDDWAFIKRKIATVRTFHGCSINESKFAEKLRSKLVFFAYHFLELWAKKLASISVGVGDDTINKLGISLIIPNGYAKDFYYYDQKASKPTAIVVGTLSGRKQARLALDLLLSLRTEISDLVIHAVVDTPYNHPAVHNWIGISRDHLAKLVRESWIGVSTTRYEGFGIYYLEWMAAGTIPITFSNIGVNSLIRNAEAGILGGNIAELREAALLMFKDKLAREKHLNNALVATQSLTWDNVAQQYIEIYKEALCNR